MKNTTLYIALIDIADSTTKLFELLQIIANDNTVTREDYYLYFTLIVKKSLILREVPLNIRG